MKETFQAAIQDRQASILAFCDFQWKALSEAASTLIKGMTFYLAIFAALMGYLLTKDLQPHIKEATLIVGLLVSVFAAVACGSIGWGYQQGLLDLERNYRLLNQGAFDEVHLHVFFSRGRRVLWFVLSATFMILVTFVVTLGLFLISRV